MNNDELPEKMSNMPPSPYPTVCEYQRNLELTTVEKNEEQLYRVAICKLMRCEYPERKCSVKTSYNFVKPGLFSFLDLKNRMGKP